jgi:thymidylate synthase (FAD)
VGMNVDDLPKFKVLNAGEVRLMSMMGTDLDIVNAARVSFASHEKEMTDKSEGLINFLMKNKHATPFEHVVFKFYIKCPIFVAREWFRHRWSSFNEMSMRYHVPEVIDFYLPERHDIRKQVGKPGSYSFEPISDDAIYSDVTERMKEVYAFSEFIYKDLLSKGLAKEIARSVLPVGQYTEFVWTVNLRSLINFLTLRNSEHAQKEIRDYARSIEVIFKDTMPVTYKSFIENDRPAI